MPRPSSDLSRAFRSSIICSYFLLQIGFAAHLHLCRGAAHKAAIFILSSVLLKKRCIFCCTFRSLTTPSLSLVSAPVKSRLSSPISYKYENRSGCPLSLLKLCINRGSATLSFFRSAFFLRIVFMRPVVYS